MQTDVVRERFREERRRWGLPDTDGMGMAMEGGDGERGMTGRDGREVTEGELKEQIREYDRTLDENEKAEQEEGEEMVVFGEEGGGSVVEGGDGDGRRGEEREEREVRRDA